ncbi:Pkinase-domain-containing protein [Neolentinus lepideus HHB14362 ss-1]|uniref:non-specific serine/threonine protein kinase n=1 Tax=Neolentinus lepideus HHB14362 ss-1 TaxID=1314782 RepID=A0A165Q8Y1_9AGAM|nr:Pkinase-domain-containing protein [Neolentinus lepideus HHB14362 ss-1]
MHTSSAPKPLLVPEKKPTVAATNGIQAANSSSSAHHSIPIPPPDAFSHDKQPGLTRETLKQLQLHQKQESTSTPSSASPTTLSPTVSESEGWSVPSSRAPSRPGSRAPSFSSVKAGINVDIPSATPTPKKEGKPIAAPVVSKTPSRAASVASDGGEKKSISIKEFLSGAGPKLARRSSQRSNASSRKSDSDGRSVGESTASLLKKYGVCERVAIGKGATSVVRLAHKWDRSEEKLYAVKEFRKRRKNETEKEYVKKLTAEFCISSTLHHVNIVETVDLVQDENQRWCEVMEFCPGGDLYAAIKRGGMSPSEVECCFRQILTGVAYLHSQGVAHRDIKPENLFFDTKGHLKIGDYGASTVYRLPWETSIHMSTGLCGSEPYIAPEQFMGKPYDARLVDIWACGIVYYCLHFQELPWPSAQLSNPLYAAYASACASPNAAQSACPPTINNLSPRACRPVIRKMLEPEPKLRSSIEDIIAHSWVQSIDVCHTMAKPTHVHVYAQQQAQAQVQMLSS